MTTAALERSGRVDARLLVAASVALAAAAWLVTAHRMAGMDAGPGAELGSVGWFAVSWLVMMAAMMLPALTPMVVVYARQAVGRDSVALFAAGYLAAWLAAGLVGYVAVEAVRSMHLGFLAWHEAGRYVAAGAIAGAGLYQLSAPKHAFLRRCCERRTFLREHWRSGRLGALRMGAEHGVDCIGASWALMAALFALGAMSLTWMAVVAVLIAAERLLPETTRLAVAAVFVAIGVGVALAPADVPGLAVPGSTAMHQMRMQ